MYRRAVVSGVREVQYACLDATSQDQWNQVDAYSIAALGADMRELLPRLMK